jgi:hypothetical protein
LGHIGPPLRQAQEIRGGQHPDAPTVPVHDRRPADLVPEHQAGGLPQRHPLGQPDDVAGHQVVGGQRQ